MTNHIPIAERGRIELPFPPAALSGHAKGHWRTRATVTKQYRQMARVLTRQAKPTVPASGDIAVAVHFYPPNRMSDRVNFPVRMKPIFDGIADALAVNDRRFLPTYHFHEPELPARVIVEVGK